MKRSSIIANIFRSEVALCGIVAIMFPTVIILYFCARNMRELGRTAIAVGITFVLLVAVVGYLAIFLLFQKPFVAMCFCMICWAGCFLQPAIDKVLPIKKHRLLLLTLFIILIAIAVSFLLNKKVEKQIRTEQILAAILGMIFVFNIAPFVNAVIQIQRHTLDEIPIKRTFGIEKDTASPNVFWIHADGMLGMDMFEKYFEDPQSEFFKALSEHGFEVNKSASFEAGHRTKFAIPVLTNPYSYDNYLNQLTETHETAVAASRDFGYRKVLGTLRQNNELMRAFEEKGYAVNLVMKDGLSEYYVPTKDSTVFFSSTHMVAYNVMESNAYQWIELVSECSYLGKLSSYFSSVMNRIFFPIVLNLFFLDEVFEDQEPYNTQMSDEQLQQVLLGGWTNLNGPRYEMEALYEVLHGNYRTPQLTIVHDLTSHYPFYYSENGEVTREPKNMNPLGYYPQHIYCTKVLLNMTDMILAADPDAVIVIQADHGLHGNVEEDFKAAFGEDADALELWNSTMSAVRVPEKYQTGDEHYAMENPLNISRYLVNSFVGQNYKYLPPG